MEKLPYMPEMRRRRMNAAEAAAKKQQERETLRNVIAQWNANRLDLFELSEPNEDLEFHGVMRFYFQDSGQKVATKCIRVASDATSQAVIETLIEKFRADMRMLSLPEYALYEIHENGEERRLGMDEKPLLVQLNWHMDDREGRFLLRRIDEKTNVPAVGFQEGGSSFKRKLSKREKKQLKKQEKLNKLKSNTPANNENDGGVAEKLYTELPETSFTRSISNPEAVMRRRRQQKLERKLQQFRSKDGGPDTGGTLKIYGESLCRDVPYKTLLLSVRDTAQQVVKEMLTKYGLDKETDPHNYCLVQVNTAAPADNGESKEYHGGTNNREYILDDDECPLAILMNHPSSRGSIMFHVRRRPADYHPRKRKKKPQQKWNKGSELMDYRYEDGYDRLPFFLELNPDGTDIVSGTPKRHRLHPNVTEVGSERPINTAGSQQHGHQSQSLQLFGPNIEPRHCVIAHTEGIVTVTPCSGNAETYVNGQRIYETTILQNGAIVKFGRMHSFRFIDPSHDDRTRQRHDSARQALDFSYDRQGSRDDSVSHGGVTTPGHNNNSTGPNGTTQNYETTFDVDGNVETVSTSSLGNKEETRSQRSVSSSRDGNRLSNYERYPRGTDPILPAVLEFREETEEAFLHAVITDLDPTSPHFKLAPTYTLYLVARYRASTHYRPELTPTERAHRLTVLLARVAAIIHNVIQERYADAKSLAFWMANSSELLHFLKSDRHISAFSLDAQDILADCVQIAFKNLVSCLQGDLAAVMPNFMSERDENPEDENTGSVLQVLSSAMALLRRCRVNAALTIQLFSQLFHFINMWAFNKVVTSPTSPHPQQPHSICYCTRAWGLRLKTRLAQLEVWAERQGLELAADCHLARIIQAAHLLQAPKYTAEDLATLSSTCFKLNSLQLRALLSKYQPSPDEPRIPHELIENVVRVAENVADELARSDGREVRLEEERELQLPFLLPEDGYSCDVVRGVPQGLAEFLAPLQHAGLCRMSTQPTSSGLWTIYMTHEHNPGARSPSAMSNRSGGCPPPQQEPEQQIIRLEKSNNGMGLSIVAAKGAGQDKLGIYIKSVVKGGAADVDGQLQAGDQLLEVDGQSLVGITQEKAAEYLVRTGPTVTLRVAKQGAIYHGLATLLQQPSPVMGRASASRSRPTSELIPSTHNIQGDAGRGQLPPSMSLATLRSSANRQPAPYQERLVDWNNYPGVMSEFFSVGSAEVPYRSQTLSNKYHNHQLYSVRSSSSGLLTVPRRNYFESRTDGMFHYDRYRNAQTNTDEEYTNAKGLRRGRFLTSAMCENFPNSRESDKGMLLGYNLESRIQALMSSEYKKDLENESESSLISSGDCEESLSPCCLNECCSQSSTTTSDTYEPSLDIGCKHSCGNQCENARDCSSLTDEKLRRMKDVEEILLSDFSSTDTRKVNSGNQNLAPVLNLDLSSIKDDDDESSIGSDDLSNRTKCWKSPEEVRLGYGRVAALAKHFSRLGDSGIIRVRGPGARRGRSSTLQRGIFRSVPDVSTNNAEVHNYSSRQRNPHHHWMDDSDTNSCNNRYAVDLGSVSYSMDDLLLENDADLAHCKTESSDFSQVCRGQNSCEQNKNDFMLNSRRVTSFHKPIKECSLRAKKHSAFCDGLYNSADSIKGCHHCGNSTCAQFRNSKSAESILTDMPSINSGCSSHFDRPRSEDNILSACSVAEPRCCRKTERCRINTTGARNKIISCNRLENQNIGNCHFRSTSHCVKDHCRRFSSECELRSSSEPHLNNGDRMAQRIHGPMPRPAGCWPRRMSERDLPSRLLSEQNHSGDPRRNMMPHAPIQSSKSVPSLNSGNNDLVHGPNSTPTGQGSAPGSKQHEAFNSGYSRTSSTNSIPQMQQQPANGSGLRSKSSQNLNDPRTPTSTLPPTGLGSRQSSNPSLHHSPHAHQHPGQHPAQNHHPPQHPSHVNQYPQQNVHLNQHHNFNHPPQNQHAVNQHQMNQQNQQQGGEGERFYQNLSIYRNHELHNGYPPPSPNRGKLPSPQAHEDRSPPHQPKTLRGSQSSLHRPGEHLQGNLRDRPASAYIPQKDQYGNPPQGQGMAPRSQSTRDIIRQEAKLQEMQEEVRRREMRGMTSPQHYPVQPAGHPRPHMLPGHPQQRVPNPNYPYVNQDPNGTHGSHNPGMYSQSPGHGHFSPGSSHPLTPSYGGSRPHLGYGPPPTAPKPTRFAGPAAGEMRPPFQPDSYNQTGSAEMHGGRPPAGGDAQGPPRTGMPAEEAAYRDSPPPPPPPTSTHPLYQSGTTNSAQKGGSSTDNRYTASMVEPPRGTYYPATSTSNQPQRHYQFNATNPWEREEREKEQQRRREAARAWRDQQIAELSSLPQRTPQQEEQLRALKLEREFQRRAEEAARQEEEEEGEDDQESVERVQGLLRMATQQQEENDPSRNQQQQPARRPQLPELHQNQNGRSAPATMPKSALASGVHSSTPEDKSRKLEEVKRKQVEDAAREQEERLQEASKRREEELRQQQQNNQTLASQSRMPTTPNNNQYVPPSSKILNPSHLRLDNLVINGPSSPPQMHYSNYQPTNQHQQYNGYVSPQANSNSPTTSNNYYHHDLNKSSSQKSEAGYYQDVSNLKPAPNSSSPSGAQRLDTLLSMSGSQQSSNSPPQPPERGSSFTVMSQTQGVLRNSATSIGGLEGKTGALNRSSENTQVSTTTTTKRVSFHDPNANQSPQQPVSQPPAMEQIREDPNHFINEAETLLASPKSPDGGPFSGSTPGVIGAQEVYKDPRTRLLAAQQHQKLMSTRSGPLPEKLSFKEKMKMFAMETGEDGTPRDKVKISRAQREIDNLGNPTGPNNNNNNNGN